MWLRVGMLWTKVAKATEDEVQWLWGFLKYHDEKRERWDGNGTVHLLSRRYRRFQTGLVPLVQRQARSSGHEVKIIDTRERPGGPVAPLLEQADLGWLQTRKLGEGRPYQFEAVSESLRSGRGIIRVPTGGGKGEIVVGICKTVPIKWLFLVHRSHLAEDIAARWQLRGDGSGSAWLRSGSWELGDRVTFSTYQTLFRGLDNPECRNALQHVQGVVGDEVHVVGADSFQEVNLAISNAYYRIGLSGTPLQRGDGKSLMAVAQTGPVVYNVTPRELMDAGFVSRATVHFREVKHEDPGKGRTWAQVRKSHIAESKERNEAVLEDVIACTKPGIVFVELKSHGRILRDAIRGAGLSCEFVWGATDKERRHELVDRLNSGELDVIVANDVFREGVDAPEIRSVVNAAGGQSVIATIQRVGRGSRITSEKTEFEIYDYRDRGQRWLARHSTQRVRTYTQYGYSVRGAT